MDRRVRKPDRWHQVTQRQLRQHARVDGDRSCRPAAPDPWPKCLWRPDLPRRCFPACRARTPAVRRLDDPCTANPLHAGAPGYPRSPSASGGKPTPRRPRPPATIRQTSVLRLRSAQRAQRLGWHLVDLTRLSSTASSSPWSRAHAREVGADEAGSAGYDPPREVRREVFLRRRQEDAGRALGVSSPRSTSPGGLADTLVACWTLLTMRV